MSLLALLRELRELFQMILPFCFRGKQECSNMSVSRC